MIGEDLTSGRALRLHCTLRVSRGHVSEPCLQLAFLQCGQKTNMNLNRELTML